ncbi:type ISP restriction/modification enzyme [Deinococcus sp. NW-56]|uniref:type ISP restriction/modification enzyme n=1 Tax=Deinococcus sp. NW-56 TaxID=2080419 RepID=UPI000CF48393|nr:type ISP restriction/modification enzyme [Deinococcus sp. NW-56]
MLTAYDFPIDSKGRTPNISKKFITALTEATDLTFAPDGETNGNPDLYTPEDVFHYIYAVLHSPNYRTRYADFLRTDFPRIPLPDSAERFRALAELGAELAGLHLLRTAPKLGGFPKAGGNEVMKGYPKYSPPAAGDSAEGRSADGSEAGKVLINPQQWFTGVPPEVWSFRVGGYQPAEKWLKDRRGRTLSFGDVQHYQRMLGALAGTVELMRQVDQAATGLWEVATAQASCTPA